MKVSFETIYNNFIEERNTLLNNKYNKCALVAFNKKWKIIIPDAVLEAGFHKARTACPSVAMKLRRESKEWLLNKGLSSLDDGDV